MHIKKGDNVIVMAGKDQGKEGKVDRAFPSASQVLIEGVNMKKKHLKKRKEGETGQVLLVARPLNASTVLLKCGTCKKGVRTKMLISGDKKERACVACDTRFA